MTVQRTKEIAIRKVVGASVSKIFLLLIKDFLKLIFISFIIALPLSLFGINQWLNSFANRMSLNSWIFLMPLLVISVITILTISSHVIKAAVANPVESLKYE